MYMDLVGEKRVEKGWRSYFWAIRIHSHDLGILITLIYPGQSDFKSHEYDLKILDIKCSNQWYLGKFLTTGSRGKKGMFAHKYICLL